MSSPVSSNPPGVYVQKPKSDVYTVLLAIALVAILIAIVVLCLELSAFKWDYGASGAQAFAWPSASPGSARTFLA